MKPIYLKIVITVFLLVSSNLFSNNIYDTIETKLLQDLNIDNIEEAQTYYAKGISHYKMHEYLSAEEAFLKAVGFAEKSDDKEILSYSFHYLGIVESWKSNYSQSIHYQKKARNLFRALCNSKYVATSNSHLAFVYGSMAEYDSALAYYQKNIQNRELIDTKSNAIYSYQNIAGTYAKLYNYKLAYHYLQEGIKFAEQEGNQQSLGELYYTAGKLFLNNHINKDIALEYLLEAKSIFEENQNYGNLNFVRLSIGDVYFKTGNDSLALQFYEDVNNNLYSEDYATQSVVNHKIATVYKERKDYENALRYFRKSINGMCQVCPEIMIHKTLIEAARTSLITGNLQEAYSYLVRAKNIADESESRLEIATSYEELGIYFQTLDDRDSSIYYFELAYTLSSDLRLPERIKKTAEFLSETYISKREFRTAAEYLKVANQMNDSLASIEKYNEVAKLEMRFEIEKIEAEIEKQKLIRNSFIAGAFILVLMGLLLWLAYMNKKKDNKLLAEQKDEIQEISRKLEQSTKRKLDFFTNISHEIRTPLTLIKAPLERIINSDSKTIETNSQLKLAINNTNKLKSLVNQILDLQKLDDNLLSIDLSQFEIISFCEEIVASFEGYSSQSKCKLIFEANIGKAQIEFDEGRLHSIITNLLTNAFKFNKENGEIVFNLNLFGQKLTLEISDTGKGISAEHLKKIGNRYYQIEGSNRNSEGSGIGLAYVKEIVELMNGELFISSKLDVGTKITISLPLETVRILDNNSIRFEINKRDQFDNKLENLISETGENGKPTILIVEDNYELRLFLCDLFSQSYNVICAQDGKEGKDLALKHLPDLIISDVLMPKIKGNELCKILKNDINSSHITIILFTAKGSPDSIIDGYDCGADDYIVKPFDTDLLLKKVKNIISTSENARKKFSFTDIEYSKNFYSDYDKKFLEDCISIIKNNFQNSSFTVEVLADNINLHRRTLLRKFNSLTGKSPADLIRHTRMTHAVKLLQENYRVGEVALLVGYEDTNRFSQAFKQFYGTSPSTYNK